MRSMAWAGIVLLACGAWGCGGGEAPPPAPAPASDSEAPAAREFEVRGRYEGPGRRENTIRISHEDIPDYMDAMTMDFPLADPAAAEGLEPGTKIRFRLTDDAEGYRVDRIETLAPDTVLELEGGPA
jgi:protein SCO1/2